MYTASGGPGGASIDMTHSILCPVDFSPQSRTALRAAAAMAARFNASLTVLFVQDPLLVAAGAASYGRRRFLDRTRTELGLFVNRAIPTKREKQQPIVVSEGNPADEILRHATRMRADLLVMGSHGLSGIRKVFFGSTTEQVLRTATVPVLAIPPSAGSKRLARFPAHVTRVVAPIDLAGEWQSDAIRAATIAGELDAELLLLHILAPVQTPPWLRSAGRSTERRRIEKAKTALERVRTKLSSKRHPVATTVLIGEPAHEVARLTKDGGSLVVMSLRGTAGVWGMRRGAIAYHVLTHASTPVLALPRRRIGGRFSLRVRKAIGDALSARDRAEMAGIDALLSTAGGRRSVRR
jgi:nucleotide-binding universal stress UspA family protein